MNTEQYERGEHRRHDRLRDERSRLPRLGIRRVEVQDPDRRPDAESNGHEPQPVVLAPKMNEVRDQRTRAVPRYPARSVET